MVTVMVMVAVLTALISPNGSVAALTPVIVAMALRAKRSPSELLLPAAFSAHAGSLLMLTGSPVTVLVSNYVEEVGGGRLGLFSIALVGAPLLVATIVISVLFGSKLVPIRTSGKTLRDFGAHGQVLGGHYELATEDAAMGRDSGVAEFIVPPRSTLIGDEVYPGMLTESGRLVVTAIHQHDHDVARERSRDLGRGKQPAARIYLAAGDRVLLRGSWEALDDAAAHPGLIAVDDPSQVRRQAVLLGQGAKRAIGVLVVMVALLTTGLLPAPAVGVAAGLAMVVLRVLTVEQAYRGISWTTVILVGAMMSLSAAMVSSGAARQVASGLVGLVGGAGPFALLAGLFLITAIMGQLISNTATALIVIPIGISAAGAMGISPVPVLVAIAVFAAGALLTPVATPANLMVAEAAGYRFGDYWRLGLPLLLLYGAAGVFLVPLIWPL